jgi:hypothetical protein
MHMTRLVLAAVMACLPAVCAAAGTEKGDKPADEPGFASLFNGKNLDGWHVMNNGKFSVKEGDGVIFLNKGGGWLRTEKEYKDFELRLDFRFLNKGADSGIFIRASKEGGNWPSTNYQVQTMDNNSIGQVFIAGKLPKLTQKRDMDKLKEVMKKTGEWQSYVITARGGNAEIKMNGAVINRVEGLVDQAGYVGLQGEGGQLEFKNIRIKELNPKG